VRFVAGTLIVMVASGTCPAMGSAAGLEPALPTFAVASIKPNRSGDLNMQVQLLPRRVTMLNVPLRTLVGQAFATHLARIRGGDRRWVSTDRFDVIATTDVQATRQQLNLMLQALLIDRFGLVVRRQSEEGSVFVLRRARARGELGPGIKPSTDDCDLAGNGSRGQAPCLIRDGWGTLSSTKMTIGQLLGTLSAELGEVVEDQTALTDEFEISLAWLPSNANPAAASAAGIAERPPLGTALDEQLGLKIVRERRPVELLIIKSAHKPTPN
jgi:uncharacterized protein (TIGR03435 family)